MTPAELRNALATAGSAAFSDRQGRKIMLVAGHVLAFAQPTDLLVAYEGEGAYLWDRRKAANTFSLISAGFGLTSAPTLVEVLNGLFEPDAVQDEAARPMLLGPSGPGVEEN